MNISQTNSKTAIKCLLALASVTLVGQSALADRTRVFNPFALVKKANVAMNGIDVVTEQLKHSLATVKGNLEDLDARIRAGEAAGVLNRDLEAIRVRLNDANSDVRGMSRDAASVHALLKAARNMLRIFPDPRLDAAISRADARFLQVSGRVVEQKTQLDGLSAFADELKQKIDGR